MGAPFGGAPAPRCARTMAGQEGAPPPSNKSTRGALVRWINDGGSMLGQIRTGDDPIYRVFG
jgi:hypothetical protein